MEYDLVIRDGLVIDGSGAPGARGDVAVHGDRIAAVGDVDGTGHEEIEADGLVVAPGFVDGHTHMDAQVFWDTAGSSPCYQGITTVVMGNCGYTLAPARPEDRQLLGSNIERAEDIPAAALAQGVPWNWTTFAEFLDALDGLDKGMNYAASIGHSALRIWAMGERAYDGPSSENDLATMERELRDALRAGAMGFTTQRAKSHTTSDGRPVASRPATWDEVARLVTFMAKHSTGGFQAGGYEAGFDTPAHLKRLQELALSSGARVIANIHDAGLTGPLDEVAARGGQMYAMTTCRDFNVLQSFETRVSFDTLGGEWQDVRSRPVAEQRHLLKDPVVRARLIDAAHHGEYKPVQPADPFKPDYDTMYVLYSSYLPNPTVAQEAVRLGIDPVEVMIDAALEHDFKMFFVQTFGKPRPEESVIRLLRHPNVAMTFSDAGAHVSQMADAIQTYLLAYWVRERQALTLEEAVNMITQRPARLWNLHDRGTLAPGYAADITIFDPGTVAPLMPRVVRDLPGGGPRLEQRAQGYAATIVNGQVFTRDGHVTETRAGRLLRAGKHEPR
jgi:N-acyl-D-aspartate/D-glutamate deacylase